MANSSNLPGNLSQSSGEKTNQTRTNASAVFTVAIAVAIVLCLISCGLFALLNPHSLAVDSVYQGF